MTTSLVTLIVLGIASGFLSLTVTRSEIFAPVRDLVFNLASPQTFVGRVLNKLHTLLTCPFCFSHWVAVLAVAVWQPRITDCGYLIADLGVSAFFMIGIASYSWSGFERLTK